MCCIHIVHACFDILCHIEHFVLVFVLVFFFLLLVHVVCIVMHIMIS